MGWGVFNEGESMLFDLFRTLFVDRPRNLQPSESVPLVGLTLKQLALVVGIIPAKLAFRCKNRAKNSLQWDLTDEDVP